MKGTNTVKKVVSSVLVMSMLLSNSSFGIRAFAQAGTANGTNPASHIAPVSSEFLAYEKKSTANRSTNSTQTDAKAAGALGYTPSPLTQPKTSVKQQGTTLQLPSSYDLRTQNLVTSVKNQGQIGGCWSFAAAGAMESNLLKTTGQAYDLSENNMITHNGSDWTPDDGGNRDISVAYFARWDNKGGIKNSIGQVCNGGPILESSDPYPSPASEATSSNIVYRDTANIPPVRHLTDALYLTGKNYDTDTSELNEFKSAIMQYGAVDTSIYADPSIYYGGTFYNSSSYAYYYNSTNIANHEILIVGWDDNYPKTNFAIQPPSNGAFLCKNSWGTDWGYKGYFYVSYYDTDIAQEGTVYLTEDTSDYKNIYQYDDLGQTSGYGYGNTTGWYSNVFTVKNTNESLAAASFYTNEPGATYNLYYVNNFNGDFSQMQFLKSGTIQDAGYHTVKLDSSIPLTYNSKFAVVVKVTNPSYIYPIPIEMPISDYSSQATASSGQSYVSYDGQYWDDISLQYPGTNVCVKAFTVSTSTAPAAPVPSIKTGTYNSNQAVSLTAASGNAIYYTTDGTEPTINSTKYTGPVNITGIKGQALSTTLKSIAVNSSGIASAADTETYTIDLTPPAVTADKPEGTYNGSVSVSLTATKSADIYYTTDGTTPTTDSEKYYYPVTLSGIDGEITTATLKYIAVDDGGNSSQVYTKQYTIDSILFVTSENPADSSVDVPVSSSVNLTFNKNIKLTDTASIVLKDQRNKTINISTNVSGNAITVTPQKSLATGMTYTLTISGGSIVDSTNNPYSSNINIQFHTFNQFPYEYSRISGQNRVLTSIEVSKEGWSTSDYVVIATSTGYADALSAGPLARAYKAPIILVDPADLQAVNNEVMRLKAKNLIIVGGTSAVSTSIEISFENEGISCQRLDGSDRYGTSLKIAENLETNFKTGNEAAIVSGTNFPDALSIAPYAASKCIPVLLTPQNKLPDGYLSLLKDSNITKCYVIGGTTAISDSVKNTLSSNSLNPERISGSDRYDTSVQIVKQLYSEFNFGIVYFASGQTFPDALSGAAIAAATDSPVILVSPYTINNTGASQFIHDNEGIIDAKYVLGGTTAVSDAVLQQLLQ